MRTRFDAPRSAPARIPFWILAGGGIFLFIAARLLLILTCIEKVSYIEELYRGAIAKEFLRGMQLPWWTYQADGHSIGSVVKGMLAAPLFELFGPKLIVMKVFPLLFSLGSLIVLTMILRKFFSARAAVFGMVLFVFAPPAFAQITLVALGNHSDSVFFTSLQFLGLYHYLYSEKRKGPSLVLMAFAAGFGTAFCNTTFVTVPACLISWFCLSRRTFFSRHLLFYAAVFLAGFSPWFAYNVTHHFEGLQFFLGFFSAADLGAENFFLLTAKDLIFLLLKGIPFTFGFVNAYGLSWRVLAAVYYGCILISILLSIRGEREWKRRIVPPVIYMVIYLFIYAVGPGTVNGQDHFLAYRYWMPFHFMIFFFCAAALGRGKGGGIALTVMAAAAAAGQFGLMFSEPFGRAFAYEGASYAQLSGQLWGAQPDNFKRDWSHLEKFAAGLSEKDQRLFYIGISKSPDTAFISAPESDPADLMKTLPAEKYPFLEEAIGYCVICQLSDAAFERFLKVQNSITGEYFYRGIFYSPNCDKKEARLERLLDRPERYWLFFGFGEYYDRPEEIPAPFNRISAEEIKWFYRGVGEIIDNWFYTAGVYPEKRFYARIAEIPEKYRPDVFWGMGWYVGETHPEDPLRARDRIKTLPPDARKDANLGLEAYYRWYGLPHSPNGFK